MEVKAAAGPPKGIYHAATLRFRRALSALHSTFANPCSSIPGTNSGKYSTFLLMSSELLVKRLLEVCGKI